VQWVSPLTDQDDITLDVTDTSHIACQVSGYPTAVAAASGLVDVTATSGVPGTASDRQPVILSPGQSAQILVAASHSCWPPPTHRYDALRVTMPGGGTIDFVLPSHSESTNPDQAGRDLTLLVDSTCPPAIGYFTSGNEQANPRLNDADSACVMTPGP
jgi:hypothetical protein